jgi:polysaccharide export outer membrane protein
MKHIASQPALSLSAALAAAVFLSLAPQAEAQSILDYQNAARSSSSSSSSMGMLSGLPGGSKLPSLPSSAEGLQALQDMNVLFETVNDSTYLLGSGDVLTIGLGSRIMSIPVNPEGYVVLEGIGLVRVGNLPLREAKKILLEKIATVYRGERLFATLSKAKKVQVSLVGAVQVPGLYVMSAAARITDLLQLAQGFTPNANKLITIINKNGIKTAFDLDRYYLGNELGQNPYVQAGDQIKAEEVDFDRPIVWIRESEFINAIQLKDGQSAYDAVTAYNSIKKHKTWNQVAVFEGEKLVATLDIRETKTFYPKSGQVLEVKSYKPTVFVGGAVMRPAYFDFNANYNALDYIASAGIVPTTGKIGNIRIIASDGSEREGDSGRIAPGDHILVPESKESRVRDYIGILASVASIVTSITLTIITLQK